MGLRFKLKGKWKLSPLPLVFMYQLLESLTRHSGKYWGYKALRGPGLAH